MSSKKNIWYHLGHALERSRHVPARDGTLSGLAERVRKRDEAPVIRDDSEGSPADELIGAGVAVVVDRLLTSWTGRRSPGFSRLLRAGAAGATAAVLVDLLRPLLSGERMPDFDHEMTERILSGVGQGLVYGAIVEPRLPGPSLLKGAVYGSVEYAADPIGGLTGLLGSHAPQGRLPFVGDMLEGAEAHERAYLEHLVFGIALAILYESSPSSSGIRSNDDALDDDEEDM